MTESVPSSPSVDQNSEPDISPVGRTRLLADIPPTTDRERELRSKFLNDPSTPEEHNLTLRYLTASQSGDEQTLRHQILARRTRRHPPADVVPGLDVPSLREHAWLDSLADAGVRVSSNFYDRLQECATPNPSVVNLGDNSELPATDMAQEDNIEIVYQHRTDGSSRSKEPLVAESSTSGRHDEDAIGPGSNALWLPEDATSSPLTVEIDMLWRQDALDLGYPRIERNLYHMPSPYKLIKNGSSRLTGWWSLMTADKKMTVQHKMTSLKGWQDAFFWLQVPDDYPVHRHFTEPSPHMEHLPLEPLTEEELAACDYFGSTDYDITYEDGKIIRSKEPSILLPHSKYILGDRPLSAFLLSPAFENGFEHLDLDLLCVDEDYRPLTHLPAAPLNEYETMHGVSNGRREGNCHGPQNLRRGRGAATTFRFPVVAANLGAPSSPAIPLQASTTRSVTRGGRNRRRLREPTAVDAAANKRQAVEDPDTSAAREDNNAVVELIEQYLEYQRLVGTYKASFETCQGLLKDAEDKLAPLQDEVTTLGQRAALLEETEENVKALTKAVEAAVAEKQVVVLDAAAEVEARGAAKAVADFKNSDDYVAELHKRYDGGWAAAMRCVCKIVTWLQYFVLGLSYDRQCI
ncbi:hypothetical protein BVRB_007740 [Beta vulgaris subsp. vulgaris]|uniref:Uncharacterized protein n=1 Tax=Beta vulgaris subsp. vulgaris TaxID=3555 RepID=A0A0J8B3B8_BETVV|nr:hypothetical protein BVRB_007740 [Beta vulgaris subsp. vulgaris]